MEINGEKWHPLEDVDKIYPRLIKPKKKLCADLAAQGYFFLANNSNAMDTQKRWVSYDLLRVASGHRQRKNDMLWAVKPRG